MGIPFVRLRWQPSENTRLLFLAMGVGLGTSLGVWLFRSGIDFFQRIFREVPLQTLGPLLGAWVVFAIIPLLALAGYVVGSLVDRFIGDERLHGVASIMEATTFSGGRLRYKRMPIKAALASFSLGAGASVGPEDPSVQIGANLGSLLGQKLRLSDERVKLLVAAGVAAGISAAFRAPIAGVFFALEIVLGDFSTSSFGVVVLTAVVSAAFTQAIEAGSPFFSEASQPELGIATYTLGGLPELPLYMLLGVIIAPIAALFIRMLYWQHDVWHHLPLCRPLRTALAGALVGVIAVFLPQIMGTGRDTLNAMLGQTQFASGLLLAFVIAKIVATTMSLGGGFQGGMFAPSLFVGAAAGRLFGQILISIFPRMFTADPAAFAIAGMAAAMTGVIRAPITAVVLLFELTDDYHLILPIMLATVVCLFVIERIAPDGIYHLGLARKGIRLVRGRDIDLMQTITVGEAMSKEYSAIPASLAISALDSAFAKTNTHGLLVLDEAGLLVGIVTLQDLALAQENKVHMDQPVVNICTRDVLTVTAETPIAEALHIFSGRDLGRLPVVATDNPRQPIGILRRRDIMRAYDLALHRKLESAQIIDSARLESYSRAHILEVRVEASSPAAEHSIRDIAWPTDCVVATIRRSGQLLVPRGDTQVLSGDILTVVTTAANKTAIQTLTRGISARSKQTM